MKKFLTAFVIICIGFSFVPLLGMTINPTTETTENKAMTEFPNPITDKGGINLEFFRQFEKYFNEHFSFRNEFVFADSKIQSEIFKVSGVDGVIRGTDGWLYYKSTLSDFLGTEKMSSRKINNLAHNLSVVDKYLEEKGKNFLLTIPPNKNTLYPENMPYYYSRIVDSTHNIEMLQTILEERDFPYCDLFELFRNESEVLYLKRDSHWNNKGALLAYNAIMESIGKSHNDYSSAAVTRSADELGDLNKMLFTFYGEKELNYKYDIPKEANYLGDYQSVEDGFIETESASASGSLLMFRDSFGNTLIPFISEQYANAWFTKEMPYGLENLMEKYNPDDVIFEKVERNLSDFIKMPPIISPVRIEEEIHAEGSSDVSSTLEMTSLNFDFNYYKISGEVDSTKINDDTEIIIEIAGKKYYTYHIDENGFEMYIKKDDVSFPTEIKLIIGSNGEYNIIKSNIFDEGDLK